MKQNKRKVSFWKKGISALRLMSTRLTIAFLAVLLIPTVLIGYFSYTSAKDQVQQKMTAPIQTILTMVGQHINNTVGERVKLLHYIDDLVGTNPGTEQYEEVRLDMNRFSTTYPEILDFSMANEQGKFITNSNIEETTSDVRNTEWYKSAISDGGKIHFSNITKDAASGKIYVEISKRLSGDKGAVRIQLDLTSLATEIAAIEVGGNGSLIVVDRNRSIAAWSGAISKGGGGELGGPLIEGIPVNPNTASDVDEPMALSHFVRTDLEYDLDVYNGVNALTGWNVIVLMGHEDFIVAAKPILITSLTVIGISVLIAGWIIFLILRAFIVPMRKLRVAARKVREGNLSERVGLNSANEFGMLAQDFDEMTQSLQSVVLELNKTSSLLGESSQMIQESTEQTTQSVQHVAEIMQQTAETAVNGAESSRQTANAVEEMARGISTIAASATTIVDSAEETERAVVSGGDTIKQVEEQMGLILEVVEETSSLMNQLSALSSEASQMNDAIADISRQTNLLSLNASIEASRAGEHGKGFAVVASEVRELSQQSKQSAEQIGSTIEHMLNLIEQSTMLMNQQVRNQVSEGMRISIEASTTIRNIEQHTSKIVDQIQDISSISEELSASTEQVSAAVTEMADISKLSADSAQTTSAAAQEQMAAMEEISASTVQLAQTADNMQQLVQRFTL